MGLDMIMWSQNMKKKQKLCYIDRQSFVAYIKTEDIYIGIAKYVEI